MGNFVIHIEGTGCHHNGKEDIDADLLAPKLVQQLKDQGHSIQRATFTAGGTQDLLPKPESIRVHLAGVVTSEVMDEIIAGLKAKGEV